MIKLKSAFILACYVVNGATASEAQTAHLRRGDVFVETKDHGEMRLTADGRTQFVSVSPNKRYLAMLRTRGESDVELQVLELAGTVYGKEVRTIPAIKNGQRMLPVKGQLEWSESSSALFFLCDSSASSNFLARLDLGSGIVRELGEVITYSVVRGGKYNGRLIALIRKWTLVAPWDWYWLLDEDGHEIGAIGGSDELAEFMDRYCEQNQKVQGSKR